MPQYENEPTVHELLRLDDRVAIVTGAAGYLGTSIARALAEAGASVVATSRQPERARQLVEELPRSDNQRHMAITMDQLEETSIRRAFQEAVDSFGAIDILINNGHFASAEDWTTRDCAVRAPIRNSLPRLPSAR